MYSKTKCRFSGSGRPRFFYGAAPFCHAPGPIQSPSLGTGIDSRVLDKRSPGGPEHVASDTRPIFNRFPAKLGPKTPPDGSGSTTDAERTKNQLRRLIIITFRDILCSTLKKLKSKTRIGVLLS